MSKYVNYEIKVFLVLTNRKGMLLLLQNNHEDSIIHGYVNPPAGHLEIGETIIDAARRETKEEMGVELEEIEIKGFVNVFGFKELPVLMFVVSAKVPDGENPTDHGEGTPIWVEPKELGKYKVLEDVEKIIKLSQATPVGSFFQVVSKFEDRKLVSFKVVKAIGSI